MPSLREKKSISIFAALQSGAKEHADKREKIGFFPYSFPFFSLISRLLVYSRFTKRRQRTCREEKKAGIRGQIIGSHSGPKYGVIKGGFPLFTTHLRAKIWGPLKEKTAHMECRQPSNPSISTQQRNIACRFKGGSPYLRRSAASTHLARSVGSIPSHNHSSSLSSRGSFHNHHRTDALNTTKPNSSALSSAG